MCRRRYQNTCQPQYLATPQKASCHNRPRQQRRGGCCNSRRQQHLNAEAYYSSNTYNPQPHTSPLPLARYQQSPEILVDRAAQPRQRRGGNGPPFPFSVPYGMASILIGAVGLGAQKIKEKRDEKKKQKAVLQWEEEQSYEEARKAAIGDAHQARRHERRKSEEAALERRASESGSVRSAEEVPPPSYEDAVGLSELDADRDAVELEGSDGRNGGRARVLKA